MAANIQPFLLATGRRDSADEGCRHRQTASPASWLHKWLREFTDDLVSPAAYFRTRQREEAEVPMVLLMPIAAGAPSLDPDALRRLAELGITDLALVRDEETVGLVLEGWAFDPNQSGRAALDALVDTRMEARMLRPLTQLAVSVVSNDGEGR
jgi:hypothetical protein